MKKIKNNFIYRQCHNWRWERTPENDFAGGHRSWKIYDRYRGHLIGVIWEDEFR